MRNDKNAVFELVITASGSVDHQYLIEQHKQSCDCRDCAGNHASILLSVVDTLCEEHGLSLDDLRKISEETRVNKMSLN
jgi:hypothetical protein